MISRRNFLKFTAMTAAAAAGGFAAGKLTENKENNYFVLQGFLPEDEKYVSAVVNMVKVKTGGTKPVIFTDGVNPAAVKNLFGNSSAVSGSLTVRVKKLNKPAASDILMSDKDNYIYNPDTDLTASLNRLRTEIKGQSASLFFSIDYHQESFLRTLFRNTGHTLIIRNPGGIAEKIDLKKDYSSVDVNGLIGMTSAEIRNGIVTVKNSCCRNKICIHSGSISEPGRIIACAHNKVLLKLEYA